MAKLVAMGSLAAVLMISSTLLEAHHSNVAFDVQKIVTVKGAVKEFRWSNPHIWLHLMITDDKGITSEWAFEGRSPTVLIRAGWSRSIFKPGEILTLDMSPAKDGSKTGMIARVTKADGTILGNAPTD
jgi:uncharacterized protein DUF6152